jgi:hypothetical protein
MVARRLIGMVLLMCIAAPSATPLARGLSFQELEPEEDALAPALLEALPAQLSEVTPQKAEAFYTEAILAQGRIDPLLAELERHASEESLGAGERSGADSLRGLLLRRRGDLGEALEIFEELCATDDEDVSEPEVWHLLQRAQLLDALGRIEDSVAAWEALLPRVEEEAIAGQVRLRLALLRMERDSEYKAALAEFASAEGRDPVLRNRAAVVLGLSQRPEDAIVLYQIDEQSEKRFRQDVRVAEWAIAAEDATSAQTHAWNAVHSARLTRDRHYGLTILIEAHRLDDSIDGLIDKLEAQTELDPLLRQAWIGLLRDRERYDEAIELFRSSSGGEFTVEMRRELLEMYREAGDEEVMLGVFRDLIVEEPLEVEWREGLSRAHLERGDPAAGQAVWRSFLDDEEGLERRLQAAEVLMELGLDELALEAAEGCIAKGKQPYAALIFLFGLHLDRGQLEAAEAALVRMGERAPPEAAERFQLADAWEQLDRQEEAIDVLEGVRAARSEDSRGEDLEMRLAWLYSEIGKEEVALERWLGLWRKINSIARRRYAEDRMMTVASRLGTLADIAIELERKLLDGSANDRESGLLVRLYAKVGDPVSAAEVIDEFLQQSGGSVVDSLQEKARVYLTCNDYFNYEEVVRELIIADPEGEGDYLRQLAMSQLERGKPDEAREVLTRLKELEMGTESLEFEAGVLAIAGLREEAIEAYRRGIAENPGRIESYLLMANLMRDLGQSDRAVGMFQHLAETAEQDDLFTIAIDGLLNLEAPAPVLEWARRITLERLAGRHDKMYLYQLLADLAEQVEDTEGMMVALENSLSISGERRPSVLRELMDIAKGRSSSPFSASKSGEDPKKHLAYGRRLIGLAEIVPPQVYLDLGEAFLKDDDAKNATKTFALASDLPDYPGFQRQAAGLFENAGFRDEALALFKRVLVARSSDVGLMVKVGELEEQEGRDASALGLYRRSLELLFSRQPLSSLEARDDPRGDSPFMWFGARNIDDFDKHYKRLLKNLLVVLADDDEVAELMAVQLAELDADLEALRAERVAFADEPESGRKERNATLAHHPRLRSRAGFYRRLAIAYERAELADALDLRLLEVFPEDDDLLESLCQKRVPWGLYGSIQKLLDESDRSEEQRSKLRFLIGEGLDERSARRLPLEQSVGLVLPLLIADKRKEAATLVLRTDFAQVPSEGLEAIEPLFSASIFLENPGLTLQIAREWVRLHVKHNSGYYMVEPVLQKCRNALADEDYRNLCLSFTDQVLEDPEEASSFLTLLPKLQKEFEEPLVTEEQVLDLLDDYADGGWGFGLGPVITLLPEENRGVAMRTVWSKVKPTTRARFLLDLVGEAEEDLGSSVSEFVEGVFAETLKEADRVFSFYITRLADSKFNHELSLGMIEALIEHKPDDWSALAGRATKLRMLGREDEALDQGMAVFVGLIDDDLSDYEKRMPRDKVFREFLPDHLDRFVAELDRVVEERSNSALLVQKRLEILERVEDTAGVRAVLATAAEEFPDDEELLGKRLLQARKAGLHLETVRAVERQVELDEEKLPQLLSAWNRLSHPINTLAVKERLMSQEEGGDEGGDTNIPGLPAGMRLRPGTMVVTSSGRFVAGTAGGKKAADDRPSIAKVKKAVDDEDFSAARTNFRRLWRKFPAGENKGRASVIYFFGGGQRQQKLAWPEEEEEPEEGAEEEEKVHRGGLDSWTDEEPEEREPPRNAYEVLAEYDFGVDEIARLLRSKTALELDSVREVFLGLLHARVLADGPEATLEELIDTVSSGRAGKVGTTMLLTLLDERPELESQGKSAVLGDLIQAVKPTDIGPLRSLARVHARQGMLGEARRLYTWLATRTSGGGFNYFGGAPTIPASELVKEVKEQLDGEERLAVIDAIIAFADPGDYPWAREQFDNLILETFMELLEPAEAMERCREILERATDFKDGLRRRTALHSATLWAQNAEIELAVECLEYGICALDESVVEGDAAYWNSPTSPGFWRHADIRRLFPKDATAFADPRAWYMAAADALEVWLAEERLRRSQAVQALVILSLRLDSVGEHERALTLVRSLAELDEVSTGQRLWIVDAARELGDEGLADEIERAQFQEGCLHLERVHELARRELDGAGPEAALELGALAIEYTLHEKLLEVLVGAAEATGDESALHRWRTLQTDAEAARTRLEEISEEEKNNAKEAE